MTDSRNDLIKDLVADLRPVARPGDTRRPLALWLAFAWLYSITIVLATGGLRSGAVAALLSTPAFAFESVAAVTVVFLLGHAALRSGIPDEGGLRRRFALPLIAVGIWVAFYVVGLWHSAQPALMLDKREHCVLQTLLFSVPSFVLLLWLVRGLLPLRPRVTAAIAGAAAAAIPGALMQFACMYDPLHILTHHITPIALIAALGAAVGAFVLTRRPTARSRGLAMH